ncbi:MAG: hypothetical protein EBX21_04000, partial [Proteobacteria bacterium]|nr:hypothetical protein [Pseudomonadota bacterium]
MSLNHLIILFTLILLLSFLGIEKIKLSFEINRLNTNQQNLLKEYETFKDKNLKWTVSVGSQALNLLERKGIVGKERDNVLSEAIDVLGN